MKFKYITITLIIFLLLFLPFLLKTIDMRLELFPSVILPSSSGTINIDKNRVVTRMELHGISLNEDTLQLDKSDFLKPIPKHYLDRLLSYKFGLKEFKYENTKTNKFAIPFKIRSKVTAAEINETKAWLRSRLRKLGCFDSVLIIKRRGIVISPNMSIIDKNSVVNDTVYNLY